MTKLARASAYENQLQVHFYKRNGIELCIAWERVEPFPQLAFESVSSLIGLTPEWMGYHLRPVN